MKKTRDNSSYRDLYMLALDNINTILLQVGLTLNSSTRLERTLIAMYIVHNPFLLVKELNLYTLMICNKKIKNKIIRNIFQWELTEQYCCLEQQSIRV